MKEKNKLVESIVNGILEKKGKNISIINLKNIPGVICDYFVICNGNTPTQVSAIAESVEADVKKNIKESPLRVQGLNLSEWVAVDYGDVIVHIFIPSLREFYNIDNMWNDAIIENIKDID